MTKKLQMLAVAAATFIILFGAHKVWLHYSVDKTPEVCLIAGEGVTLKSGPTMILMDGLFREGFPEDKLASTALMSAIEEAKPPYDEVDLVTISHKHIDHFSVASLLKFLTNNHNAKVLMPPEASSDFFINGGNGFADRVVSLYPERGTPMSVEINGIGVTVYNLDHGSEVENIGVLVELDGKTFFHMGDFSTADFEGNGIEGMEVDYLLLPYWYLRNEANFKLIEDHMKPKYLVPIHMPQRDLPPEMIERVGSFDDLFQAVKGRADNVLMLYDEGSCFRPGDQG